MKRHWFFNRDVHLRGVAHCLRHSLPKSVQLPVMPYSTYIFKPRQSRTFNRVLSEGFPVPRSIATSVLMPTPAKSARVCWEMPSFFLLSEICLPIFSISEVFFCNCKQKDNSPAGAPEEHSRESVFQPPDSLRRSGPVQTLSACLEGRCASRIR